MVRFPSCCTRKTVWSITMAITGGATYAAGISLSVGAQMTSEKVGRVCPEEILNFTAVSTACQEAQRSLSVLNLTSGLMFAAVPCALGLLYLAQRRQRGVEYVGDGSVDFYE